MNLGVGALILLGLCILVLGTCSKFLGVPLLKPYVGTVAGCFVLAITCFVLAMVIDRFENK